MDHLQQGLQPRADLFGDFKRRCYGEEGEEEGEQQQPLQQDPGQI